MTPDELRERAAAATDPLVPGPASYEWLRANVARRRRRARVVNAVSVAAGIAIAGAAYAAVPLAGGDPSRDARPAAQPAPAVAFDVDGDRVADVATVVDGGTDRWGVRVERSALGTTIVWMPMGRGLTTQAVRGSTDIDRDGVAEVLVSLGDTGVGLTEYAVLTQRGARELVWLTRGNGHVATISVGDRHPGYAFAFGCLDAGDGGPRELVLDTLSGGNEDPDVARVYYRITDGRLTPVRSAEGRFSDLPPRESCYVE